MQQNGVHNVNQIDKILFYKLSIIEHVRCVFKGGFVIKSLISLLTNSAYVDIPFLLYSKEPLHWRSKPIFRKTGYFKMVKKQLLKYLTNLTIFNEFNELPTFLTYLFF